LAIYGPLETVSGGYLYDYKLVERLRAEGDTVEIVSLPWRSYASHLLDNFSPSLQKRLLALQLDLLLQDELNHPSFFLINRRLAGRIPYPMVSIVHHLRGSEVHPAWQMPFYRLVERRYLQTISAFVFNSQTTRMAVQAALRDRRPLPAHVVAFPAGDRFSAQINMAELTARARQPGPLRVLFLGSLIARKGLHTLLEALRRLPPSLASLDVAGGESADPGYARRMRRLADKPFLHGRVTFHGALDNEPLADLLRRSQVLALPSSYEGYGIAYLEGMSFGLPAIGGQAGAAGEIISDGLDGFLVAPDDAACLAEVLTLLASDRGRLDEMSVAALQRFQSHPTWDDSTGKIQHFLHTLLPPPD
jgi:glycosyltransferase involved in cell wall biosynthesis